MRKLFLGLVMLPSPLWRSMGADTEQLRAILNVRLMLDDRKPAGLMGMQRQKKKKNMKFATVFNLFMFGMLGFFYMFPLMVINDRVLAISVYYSLMLTVVTFMLITDFSAVLFDARDKFILFPRPVSDRTIVLARMLHVFIYLFRVIVPMSLAGWIFLGVNEGWKAALLFVVPLLLLVFLALFLVNGIYLIVLRLSKPEKFKDIINYFQILAAVIFFITVYFVPRVFDPKHPMDFDPKNLQWLRYVPSYWLATCWTWIGLTPFIAGTALYSVFAVVLPLVCLYILVKWLTPQFTRRISGIDTEYVRATPVKAGKSTNSTLYQTMAGIFNRSDDAKAGFMIAWLQTSRNRNFRMRVYPSFAFVPIYFVYLLTQGQSFSESFSTLADSAKYLLLLYLSSFVMVNALNYIMMSDQYKAGWVYYAAPIMVPGKVMVGALKAFWVKFFLPFFAVLSAFVLYIWGVKVIWDILLALTNVSVLFACMARISYRSLPFSQPEQMKQSGGRIIKAMGMMLIPGFLGFGHYLSLNMLWLKLIFLVLSSIFLWLVLDSYANTSWAAIMKREEE
jgi:ABC-2 type transport system permease protein